MEFSKTENGKIVSAYANNGDHTLNLDRFEVIHLNLSDNVLLTIKPECEKWIAPNSVMLTIDDIVALCAQKLNTNNFEVISSDCFREPKEKTFIKFVKDGDNFIVTSPYQYEYDKSKTMAQSVVPISQIKNVFKHILEQMYDVYTFYRSNIDWTKDDVEKKKSNDMGKRLDKIKKQIDKL